MRKIELTQGLFAVVDDSDYKYLNQFNWCVSGKKTSDRRYATRTEKGKKVSMHREIMNAQLGECVDHISRDGLDNRKSNLRICTVSQNGMNRRGKIGGTSKFKGVSSPSMTSKWVANIRVNGKNKCLGRFENNVDAAKAYDVAAKEYYGEFARTNF